MPKVNGQNIVREVYLANPPEDHRKIIGDYIECLGCGTFTYKSRNECYDCGDKFPKEFS